MIGPADLQDMMDEYDTKVIEEISYEYGKLMDWFNAEYPESTIRLEVNSDQTKGVLNYTLSVLTGKEMNDDQLAMTNTIVVNRTRFEDYAWMRKFIASIVPMYQKAISKAINRHYKIGKGMH